MKNERDGTESMVFVIDDDASVREVLGSLLRSVGLQVKLFGSTGEFLQSGLPEAASCLVLDVRLPGLSGLDFQSELSKAGIHIPIIFITGHGDVPMAVKAMKSGAVEFLAKPVRDQDLLDAVNAALERDLDRRNQDKLISSARSLFDSLSPREQKVMALVSSGLMNKVIAAELGLSEVTVKVHRGNVMRKMGARSLADLVRMADILRICSKES
jgi:FixJ family two-component response regulator